MARKLTLAALVLALGLTAAGCGSTAGAGTTASRWADTEDGNAIAYQNEARGPLSDGYYAADEEGRVAGFHRGEDGTGAARIGRNVRRAGEDMVQGVKDAAKNAGDMAEEAVDGAAGASETDRDRADHIFDPSRN